MNEKITPLVTFKKFKSTLSLYKVLDCFGHDSYIISITKNVDDKKCRSLYITYSLAKNLIVRHS